MSSNADIIKATVTTADITGAGKGGRLNPEQSNRFRDYMVDNTAFLKDINVETMNAPEKYVDTLQIGNRIIREAIEGQGPGELAGVAFPRTVLRPLKVRLAADITTEFGEDNIERGMDHIARSLAAQFGNDLADLGLNGDISITNTDPHYDFLKIADGIIKQAKVSTDTHKVTLPAAVADTDYKDSIFPAMLSAMPNMFKRNKADLRFYCSSKVSESFMYSLMSRFTVIGDNALTNGNLVNFMGIRVFPVEYMPDDVIILTSRHNLVTGIQRDMTVYTEFSRRKDLTEYTMYMRVDPGKIVWDDALVIASK